MDSIGMHYYSGFHGTVIKKFIPQYYNSDYVDYFGIDGTNYQVNQQHVNLYKLHGSLSWRLQCYDNNDTVVEDISDKNNPVIVYPSINKYNDTNEVVIFTTLQRFFSQKLSHRKSSLIVIGSSLNDQHINKIIENSLLDNTFNLVLFPFTLEEKARLEFRYANQNNVFVYYETGVTLAKFSEIINPSINEEPDYESED